MLCYAGFTNKQWATYIGKKARLQEGANASLPGKLPQKVFKKVYTAIPDLDSYEQAQDAKYWETWTKRTYQELTRP